MHRNFLLLIFAVVTTVFLAGCRGCSWQGSATTTDSSTVAKASEKGSRWPTFFHKANVFKKTLRPEQAIQYEPDARKMLEILMDSLPKVDSVHWVMEGDLLMDMDDLKEYCMGKIVQADSTTPVIAGLTVCTDDHNELIIWPKHTVLKYSVLKDSFYDTANYHLIVTRMKHATEDWMRICDVQFEYDPQFDNVPVTNKPPDPNHFFVQEARVPSLIAVSFYPMDPSQQRRLKIDRMHYYNAPYNGIGILRHELGHILGCRHEQIWSADQQCKGETAILNYLGMQMGARLIGNAPDPNSVMHYKCGSQGNWNLDFTPSDKASAAAIFGTARYSR